MPVNITEEFVSNLITQIETLTAQNQALTATVAELNQTIKELKEKLNKNSKNSSKPPSSDGLKKRHQKVFASHQEKKQAPRKDIRGHTWK